IFSRDAATGFGMIPIALAVETFVFLILIAGEFSQGAVPIQSADVTLLSQTLFSEFGAYLLLLGTVMLGALSGAIYLVREGRE
ncbi:MAG: hypothetical protein ACREB9_04490, partial [Thermoplasmata archaeon]